MKRSTELKMMMQSELPHPTPTWPLFYNIPYAYSTTLDSTGQCDFPMAADALDNTQFPTFFSTQDPSLDTLFATMTPDNHLIDFSTYAKETIDCISDDCQLMDQSIHSDENLSSDLSFQGSADVWSPLDAATASSLSDMMDLSFPGNDNVEMDSRSVLHHLLTAYGEAMEIDQKELMEVIAKRVNSNSKVDPFGDPVQRLAFHLLQTPGNQSGYLRRQSSKNSEAAHKVFYEMFPYGRFAHFTANSAILEAIPKYAEIIHIVDFDMGNGIQWPPLIEELGRLGKALRLTSIKPDAGDSKFLETKRGLYNYAQSIGFTLRVEEMSLRELKTEIKSKNMLNTGRDWLAFNCMVGLPHMSSKQNISDVRMFVSVAKELLAYNAIGRRRNNAGILTFGDAGTEKNLETSGRYSCYFNSRLMHYQALLESMEGSSFPAHLTEARVAIESLFVAPNIRADSWLEQWKHNRDDQGVMGLLEGKRISKESLNEAKELVNETGSSYKINIHGEKGNRLVLEWKGTSLVTVSTWM